MGRRRFLQSLSALGISGAALQFMTSESLAEVTDDPSKRVPRLRKLRHTNHEKVVEEGADPEYEPFYYTIPRDEWAAAEAPLDAMKRLRERINESSGISENQLDFWVRPITSGGHTKRAIIVEVPEFETPEGIIRPDISKGALRGELPTTTRGVAGRDSAHAVTVDDIPVRIRKTRHELHDNYEHDYQDVPAGCYFETEKGGSATLGTPAKDTEYDEVGWVTAGHNFEKIDASECYQPYYDNGENYIGNKSFKSKATRNFDAAFVNAGPPDQGESGETPEWRIAASGNGYRDGEIMGIWGRDDLIDSITDSKYIYKQGISTGNNSGQGTGYTENRFSTTADAASGDSGGPHYITQYRGTREHYIAGIHRGAHDYYDDPGNSSDSVGTMMEVIADSFNLHV